ncbi:MAG: NAD(P)H-hydrate dehydratase [candidate division WOR-3 bacterium]|nr:MAG: NAD(P)H-hydrate dehydratase [candidate division WOR-3 bacterium]
MRVVTNAEMKKIDDWAIRKMGIPGPVLMENAGRGCVEVLEKYFDLPNLKVLVICGKGNNGGDGFVIARHLLNRRAFVKIVLLGQEKELKGDAQLNFRFLKSTDCEVNSATGIAELRRIHRTFHPDVIIDAVFGTGFSGSPEGIYDRAIDFINDSDAFILAIDIPSGINGNDGQFKKTCVIADATATMCLPKRGHYLFPGRAFCGDLHVVDIGIPYSSIDEGFPRIVDFEDMFTLMPFRPPDGNKGTFGNVLVIAGARGFSGAAAMAAHSALKSGAGLVRLASPRGIIGSLEAKLLEVIKIPLAQTEDETISPAAIEDIKDFLKTSTAIVVGPGITTHPGTAEFLEVLLTEVNVPCIIDADAINILAQNPDLMRKTRAPVLMTPHPGELARLIRSSPHLINQKRIDIAVDYAKKFNCVLVLKGAPTVIAGPDGKAYLNTTGNSGLASAGSGDVLVGMISGFVAQKQSLLNAAVAGVFMHGLAADLAMEESNEYSLTAADLIKYTPRAFNYLLRREFEQ